MELAIDTSSEMPSIALTDLGVAVREFTWRSGSNHTVELMPAVVRLLESSGDGFEKLTGIVVALGPGSFNGLRVGVSAAKALAFSLRLPIVGISTLEAEAWPFAFTELPLRPVHDIGRGELAVALFRLQQGDWRRLEAEHVTTPEALLKSVTGPTLFCGEVPDGLRVELSARLPGEAIVPGKTVSLRRASFLAELGWRRLSDGESDNAASLQPLYLRHPHIGAGSGPPRRVLAIQGVKRACPLDNTYSLPKRERQGMGQ